LLHATELSKVGIRRRKQEAHIIRHLVAGTLIGTLLSPSPAAAQSVDQDIRCMLLSHRFKNAAKEAPQKQAAEVSAIYYFGRVAARVPTSELKSRLIAQDNRLKGQQAGPLMNACFQQLKAQERAMNAVSQEIARSAPKEAPKK
jgi:hypothetical protein